MDQVKIGKYIASKRKALGMTQAQVAEKIGMSDKSVSKWERGICLPDVSVYMELCEILGITLNEFIAGEDIEEVNIIKQSEKNIISITKAGIKHSSKLKKIIALLAVAVIILGGCFGGYVAASNLTRTNYIEPVDTDSAENEIAQLVTSEGAYLFDYSVDDSINSIYVKVKSIYNGLSEDDGILKSIPSREGTLAIIPDMENGTIMIVDASEAVKSSCTLSEVDSCKKDMGGYLEIKEGLQETKEISAGDEIGLLVIAHNKDEIYMSGLDWECENPEENLKDIQHCLYVSVMFSDEGDDAVSTVETW